MVCADLLRSAGIGEGAVQADGTRDGNGLCGGNMPGAIGIPEETAREALRLAQHKLPIKTKIVKKAEQEVAGE